MAIEESITIITDPIKFTLLEFLSVFVIDLEKLLGLAILILVGLVVAKWGKGIIAGILKKIFSNKKLQELTHISPDTLKDPKGWNSLIYNIPDLFRVLILVLIVSVALDLLEFEQASGIVGEIFAFLPNLIAVVFLLWGASWLHNLGKEWFASAKNTLFKGDTNIARYGFYCVLWGTVISISLTQLGIGGEIIPILVAGVMASMSLIIGYGLKDEIRRYFSVESLKQQGIEVGQTITLDSKDYTIESFGFTHIKVKDSEGKTVFINNGIWTKDSFVIKSK